MSRTQRRAAAILNEAAFTLMSRILIVVIALLLAIIPWSERYSILDSFPHTPDTELNLLALFVILGLILLIARSGKMRLRTLLACRHVLLAMIRPAQPLTRDSRHLLVLTDADHPPPPGSSLDLYNLPLLI